MASKDVIGQLAKKPLKILGTGEVTSALFVVADPVRPNASAPVRSARARSACSGP